MKNRQLVLWMRLANKLEQVLYLSPADLDLLTHLPGLCCKTLITSLHTTPWKVSLYYFFFFFKSYLKYPSIICGPAEAVILTY